mmetsp:Transcript_24058/g.51492  ORF Transcript_24058/g.51492 Transcript_24058/m.51492 type:complete len:83 (-) Transcript_24058:62-310(-)
MYGVGLGNESGEHDAAVLHNVNDGSAFQQMGEKIGEYDDTGFDDEMMRRKVMRVIDLLILIRSLAHHLRPALGSSCKYLKFG